MGCGDPTGYCCLCYGLGPERGYGWGASVVVQMVQRPYCINRIMEGHLGSTQLHGIFNLMWPG